MGRLEDGSAGQRRLLTAFLSVDGQSAEAVRRLLDEFGCIGSVLAAEPARLRRIAGSNRATVERLGLLRELVLAATSDVVEARPVIDDWAALLSYARARCGFSAVERFSVLFLDLRYNLIRDEEMARGTVDEAPVYVREVLHRAFDCGASNLILLHNHPSGCAEPSRADVDLTRRVVDAGKPLRIAVLDHLIVTRSAHVSMRSRGLL